MLTINRFSADYRLYRGAPDAGALQRRMDRLVRERLPGLLAEIFPAAQEDANAVYRIRRLRIDLWLDLPDLMEGDIASRWARLIAQATVRTILYGSRDEVMRFEDAGHYLASFLIDLMGGTAWQKWEYSEYRALEGLTAGQAAAYLLSARPEWIGPVAARLDAGGHLDRLVFQMNAADARLIWERGLGFPGAGLALPQSAELSSLLRRLRESSRPVSTARIPSGTFECERLRAYLRLTLSHPSLAGSQTTAAVAHALAMIQRLYALRPSARLWQALAGGEIDSPAALAPVLSGLEREDAPLHAWLATRMAEPDGLQHLAILARTAVPQSAPATQALAIAESIPTLFAGLGLLLPVARQMALFEQVGQDGIYQLLLNAIPPDFRPLAWGDPAPMILAAVSSREAEAARERPVQWPALQSGVNFDPKETAFLPITQAVLRRLTQGLRGFENSSPGYLVSQLIHQPGQIEISPTRIEIHLAQAPLGILLSTYGKTGEQGRIPWLENRRLAIFLPGE